MNAKRMSRQKWILGMLVGLLVFAILATTLDDFGINWDEPLYMKAATRYLAWLGILRQDLLRGNLGHALSDSVITEWWVQPFELHPPVGKLVAGISWALTRRFAHPIAMFRLGYAAIFALMTMVLFWMVAEIRDTRSATFSVSALLLMPHVFAYANMVALDSLLTSLWVMAVYVFWKVRDKAHWGWTFVLGLLFGLAFGTKFTAILMPATLFLWVLLYRRSRGLFFRLVAMGLIGFATFFLIWPWLYAAPLERLAMYLGAVFGIGQQMGVEFSHATKTQYYLGQVYHGSPWHYPFVLTFATVPATLMLTCLVGGIVFVRAARRDEAAGLVLLNIAVPIAVTATGLSAAYNGVRQFLPVFPYLAALAGTGFGVLADWVEARLSGRGFWLVVLVTVVVALALLIPPARSLVNIHPYELAYYSEWVGGVPGAYRLGLETTFWCDTYIDALPYLNAHAAPGELIWAESPAPLRMYQQLGMLRCDVTIRGGDLVDPYTCDFAVIQARQSGYTTRIREILATRQAVHSLWYNGVLLMAIYHWEKAL
ncbi:MAG: glycosyltransferase family 39 protein [Chloroflexi bacterium]|nr:glycosyltransferase family 39 protein [Chloroflexota bacterium]